MVQPCFETRLSRTIAAWLQACRHVPLDDTFFFLGVLGLLQNNICKHDRQGGRYRYEMLPNHVRPIFTPKPISQYFYDGRTCPP